MKKTLTISFILLLSLGAKAQSADDIEFFQSIWGMEKRAIVENYMDFTTDEATTFWEAYETYEVTRKELGKERVIILKEYAENYESLSGEKATDLINRAGDNNIAMQKLLKKTFKKMSKSIDAVKAAQFIQMENYFMIAIQMYIQENIPFVDQLER